MAQNARIPGRWKRIPRQELRAPLLPSQPASPISMFVVEGKSPGKRDRYGSPPIPISACTASEAVQVEELQSEVAFLRLQFDNQQGDEFGRPDVKIIVQDSGEFLFAHKLILSTRSPVFCKMFNAKMLEEQTGIVRIHDATFPVFHAVVKFCYDAEVTFTEEVPAEDVLEVAHMYDIPLLLNKCEDCLIGSLNIENLPRSFKLSEKFGMSRLETAANYYLKNYYHTVVGRVKTELSSFSRPF